MSAALEDAIFDALGSFWWLTPREKLSAQIVKALSTGQIIWRDGLPAVGPGETVEAVHLSFHEAKVAELQNDLEIKQKTKKSGGKSQSKRRKQ